MKATPSRHILFVVAQQHYKEMYSLAILHVTMLISSSAVPHYTGSSYVMVAVQKQHTS